MKNLTFGIEIELTGITRERAAGTLAKHFETSVRHTGGGYDTREVEDQQGRTWKIVSDSSINAEWKNNELKRPAGTDYRVEMVSPICTYEDIETLQELVRALRKGGAFENESCGIHIHVGGRYFSTKALKNLVNIMTSKEDLIYKALEVDGRRENSYCRKIDRTFSENLNKKTPETFGEFADLWYEGYGVGDRGRHYHSSRYHGLNLHSFFNGPTVEFRLYVQKNVMCS